MIREQAERHVRCVGQMRQNGKGQESDQPTAGTATAASRYIDPPYSSNACTIRIDARGGTVQVMHGLQPAELLICVTNALCYTRSGLETLIKNFHKGTLVDVAPVIVGHLSPDVDCLCAIWVLRRWGGLDHATLRFVPSGQTLEGQPADSDPLVIHVDTGRGKFDHHGDDDHSLSATELVRRAYAPKEAVLQRIAQDVTLLDHALAKGGTAPDICDLIEGFNALYPATPEAVASAMFASFDAWYAYESKQLRLETAFSQRIEFDTPWGFGIAMESDDGGSSRLAYGAGAVLYAYRDGKGNMGVAAKSRASVDLTQAFHDLKRIDPQADWYLHPSRRLLLCGTPKSPPRVASSLTLEQLVGVLRGDHLF